MMQTIINIMVLICFAGVLFRFLARVTRG